MDKPHTGVPVTASFIGAIIQSYEHLWRTMVFFGLIFIFLFTGSILFFRSVGASGELKAELKDNGGLVFEFKKNSLFSPDEKTIFSTFLLPSNVVWFDTGLELDSNQECKFRISGTTHLAVHTVVKQAGVDQRNPVPWTTSNGNKFVNIGDSDKQISAKKSLLLKPGETIGNVLGYLAPMDEANDFRSYFVSRREELTPKIFTINHERTIPNDTGKKIRIFLSVNDILLNFDPAGLPVSKTAYLGDGSSSWLQSWNYISSSKYDNLYFDDNIGCFLVQVEISEKQN
ncbi:hypothetical protein [Dyadobacter sp. CY323]|uniref:hypothetical protein n=1 Tax=Dyadobacter sp. CY323 TaxID=2907302 RepID=UPI001F1B0B0B|nr:hypothetical protein [Dyadobacter sp. CY323]MCE6989804.1 hypothetical protein [Dyadobacter sp. CY323]